MHSIKMIYNLKMIKVDIDKIFEILKAENTPRTKFVDHIEGVSDPFYVLLSCILSLRTKDETTYPATLRLFKLGKTPEDFSKIDEKIIEKAIYPVGFYRNKSRTIIDICNVLVENYDSIVPDMVEELVKLKGVGRKTANLVVAKGYDKPAICVDIHVHRISNRLGYVKTDKPDETEMVLRKKLPKKYWKEINTLFVTHGQSICRPISPKCEICPINRYCNKLIK